MLPAMHPFPCRVMVGKWACNIVENGDAILWKNYLQLSPKSTCRKHTAVPVVFIIPSLKAFSINLPVSF